jgi:hypothetical protein
MAALKIRRSVSSRNRVGLEPPHIPPFADNAVNSVFLVVVKGMHQVTHAKDKYES